MSIKPPIDPTVKPSLTSAAPLAVFRIVFGGMMLASVVRFWANGWIEKLYLEPTYFFSYRYFAWVKPPGDWTYLLFITIALSSACIMIGWKYRAAMLIFFLSFTYVELMDKTTYLNHYYFVSLLSFVLLWLPLGSYFSLDARGQRDVLVPRWTIVSLQVFVGVVYFYAGLAKLNSDWLVHAQPLSIWLPAKYDLPLLGGLMHEPWVHYAFSWAGAAYDLCIPFLLLWKPTRWWAFGAVVVFHVLTRVLFPIGMFPFIMIGAALIFFSADFHEWIISRLRALGSAARSSTQRGAEGAEGRRRRAGKHLRPSAPSASSALSPPQAKQKLIVAVALLLHLLLPWRYALYPGELFWTESGYRFSWRVMLMEKAGYLNYRIEDPTTGKRTVVNPGDYLTTFQAKQLATQPDFILEFAHHLATEFQQEGRPLPAVYAESYVALNGRGSRPYVNPEINLTQITYATPRTEWLLPFEEEIYGL